jgi:hypothetical protein
MVSIWQHVLLPATIAGLLVVAGCGHKPSVEGALQTKAFDSASPQIKEAWGAAISGLHTNDFNVGAQIALWDLRQQTALTAEQRSIVEQTLKALSGRMFEAAGRGEPAALKAMKDVRERRSDR